MTEEKEEALAKKKPPAASVMLGDPNWVTALTHTQT